MGLFIRWSPQLTTKPLLIKFSTKAVTKLNKNTTDILKRVRRTGEIGKILSEIHTTQEKTIIQKPKRRFVHPIRFKENCKRSMNSCCTRK
jgi:hypothetical protein